MATAPLDQTDAVLLFVTARTDGREASVAGRLQWRGIGGDPHRGEWTLAPEGACTTVGDSLTRAVKDSFVEWIDTLGQESAKAQGLKQAITCKDRLRPDGGKAARSPQNTIDWLYLLVSSTGQSSAAEAAALEPVAFLRIGQRALFLENEGRLVKRDPTLCALDFYSRVQRRGLGLFLLSQALQEHAITAQRLAFDRPTQAMVSFLQKHFCLQQPLPQHNRFVIFSDFFRPQES